MAGLLEHFRCGKPVFRPKMRSMQKTMRQRQRRTAGHVGQPTPSIGGGHGRRIVLCRPCGSVPLASAAAVERDDLASRAGVDGMRSSEACRSPSAARGGPSRPRRPGLDAGRDPEHDQIVEQVGAFLDDRVGLAVHRVDDDLDRLFGKLLGHLAAARAQQPRCPRGRRIGALGGDNSLVKAVERSAIPGHNLSGDECVNDCGQHESVSRRKKQAGATQGRRRPAYTYAALTRTHSHASPHRWCPYGWRRCCQCL